jgi:hypothetical protein
MFKGVGEAVTYHYAMTQRPEDYLPTANRWFSPTLEYVGRCRAEFSAPRGSVEGPAKVSVDEAGHVIVEMTPERDSLQTDSPFPFGLVRFFGGDDFVQDLGGGVSSIDITAQNPCTRLEVETPHGTFRTEDVLYYGTHSVIDTGEVTEANFAVGLSAFDANDAEEPEYWVLPLANFLSECRQRAPDELDRHPLRVFPTPEVPNEITHVVHGPDEEKRRQDEERAILSLHFANSKNWLIVFQFADGLGFVERLPDHSESEQLLLEGKERHKTTAVMVGPTGGQPVESFEQMRGWFPFDVLSLLTLATGTEVGCPWVDLGVRPFRKGYHLIEEIPMTRSRGFKATGRLIERSCSRSTEFGETFVRAAIVHLTRARYEDQTLDDSMSHLARGFETLCKRYRTIEQDLSKNLGMALRQNVQDILDDAARRIRDLKNTAAAPGEVSTVDQIANRAKSANQRDKAFGLAVTVLLKAFWLPDAQILEEHYRGRTDSWGVLLSHYRGDVTHHGYLDILEAGHDWEEIAAIRNHLHDALARVILKILQFDGSYNPGVVTYRGAFAVDWVKPHFSARALGYKR